MRSNGTKNPSAYQQGLQQGFEDGLQQRQKKIKIPLFSKLKIIAEYRQQFIQGYHQGYEDGLRTVRYQEIGQLRDQLHKPEKTTPLPEQLSPPSKVWQRGHTIGHQQGLQGQYIFSLPYQQLPESGRDRTLFINGYREGLISGLQELHQTRLDEFTKSHNHARKNQGRER